jgi:hypothetical protein
LPACRQVFATLLSNLYRSLPVLLLVLNYRSVTACALNAKVKVITRRCLFDCQIEDVSRGRFPMDGIQSRRLCRIERQKIDRNSNVVRRQFSMSVAALNRWWEKQSRIENVAVVLLTTPTGGQQRSRAISADQYPEKLLHALPFGASRPGYRSPEVSAWTV